MHQGNTVYNRNMHTMQTSIRIVALLVTQSSVTQLPVVTQMHVVTHRAVI